MDYRYKWPLQNLHQTRRKSLGRPKIQRMALNLPDLTTYVLGTTIDWPALVALVAGMAVALVIMRVGRRMLKELGCNTPSCCGCLTEIKTDQAPLIAPDVTRSDAKVVGAGQRGRSRSPTRTGTRPPSRRL